MKLNCMPINNMVSLIMDIIISKGKDESNEGIIYCK